MGTLLVVATPLGNLEDLSPRAQKALSEADLIACEDTRHTQKLLNHFGIRTATVSYHEHNEPQRAEQLLERLRSGLTVALVSDAGTPLISDPGYRMVRRCRQEGLKVVPIPGPSAAVAALSVSGLASDQFHFAGFPPRKTAALKSELSRLAGLPSTLIFYLSPHRLAQTLQTAAEVLGDREAFLIREMTKLHETSFFGTISSIVQAVSRSEPRGEYTLVVGGAPPQPLFPEFDLRAYVEGIMKTRHLTRKEAVRVVSQELNLPRRQVYEAALDLERE